MDADVRDTAGVSGVGYAPVSTGHQPRGAQREALTAGELAALPAGIGR